MIGLSGIGLAVSECHCISWRNINGHDYIACEEWGKVHFSRGCKLYLKTLR